MTVLFSTRTRVLGIIGPFAVLVAFGLSAIAACTAPCDILGVFYTCNIEGPHEIVTNPPPEWRARAADVQEELFAFSTRSLDISPDRFVWRDTARLVFVRVLGHGIPGGAMRTDGDTVLFNPEVERNVGAWRHEFVHWVQPGNSWLQPLDDRGRPQIHWPPPFNYAHAPITGFQ